MESILTKIIDRYIPTNFKDILITYEIVKSSQYKKKLVIFIHYF